MSSTPSWPSLYPLNIELFPIEDRDPVQPRGAYLHNPHDIFRFTLYWTLVFYTPAFLICGVYAFLNLTFPPTRSHKKFLVGRPPIPFIASPYYHVSSANEIPLRSYDVQLSGDMQAQARVQARGRSKPNVKRSRWTFALLVFLTYALAALTGAVFGSAVIGYVLAGLFKAGKFNMSTWIPFTAALLQTLVCLLGLWPRVIDFV
ncbi:hypothetical protein A0H81_05984 [Grifola frondosa]|uniref:Integral membrane protein n=1 Tax=Grifola frondosa TaxID=5627 RepID=A0A1C7MAP6_GRIFR|nr:hypothetical protein A0H81_05984 [Grifola frondosa]